MSINITMPALSPTMEEGKLAKWHVKEGDSVSSGDVIAEIETDKATMEVEAVDEGRIGKILVAEGSDPAGNDAGPAAGVRIGLIHEQCGIAGLPIDLGVPVVILQRFIVRITERNELLGAPVDVERAQGQVINDGIEPDTGLLEQAAQDFRRPVARHILRHHPFQ